MKKRYDIIVVGGGPGGIWTAKHAAEKGVTVLLLEKDREIGLPVRCAEGVAKDRINKLLDVQDRWIAQTVHGGCIVSPDGTVAESLFDASGYVLHRKIFDADLAAMAVEAGCEIVTKAYVYGLLKKNGTVSGVRVSHLGSDYDISCSIVIGSDGVESRVGRWGGLVTQIPVKFMASCVQMTLSGIDINPEMVQFHFGRHIAPGGYGWVFPKGSNTANVGLGISGEYSGQCRPLSYLQTFIKKTFPGASVLTTVAGGVPMTPRLKNIVNDGLMLVGDAARQANPMSGEGIINAMIAGRIAGWIAAEAISEGDVSARRLSVYPREWDKVEGKNNIRSFKIKQVVARFHDEDLNRINRMLLDIPPEKRTAMQLFKIALKKHPKLLLEAAKIYL